MRAPKCLEIAWKAKVRMNSSESDAEHLAHVCFDKKHQEVGVNSTLTSFAEEPFAQTSQSKWKSVVELCSAVEWKGRRVLWSAKSNA